MSGAERPRQENVLPRREQLLAELMSVIEQRLAGGESYTEISVDRLVAAAGVPRSTFYGHFNGKGDLLASCLNRIAAELLDDFQSPDIAALTESDVHETVSQLANGAMRHAHLLSAIIDAHAYDADVRAGVDAVVWEVTDKLRQHLTDGQTRGYVDVGLHADESAAWLVWMGERIISQILGDRPPAQRRAFMGSTAALIWNMLYAPSALDDRG